MKLSKLLFVLPILAVVAGVADARLTGTNPTGSSADVFCVGKKAAEVCVDSSGNFIPTTTGNATLGSASLIWLQAYITTLTGTTVGATTGNITTLNSTTIVNSGTASSNYALVGTVSEINQTVANNSLQVGSAANYFAVTTAGTWAERHGTAPVASSCGTNPSVVSGNNQTGDITLGSTPGATCTLTFAAGQTATNIPECTCSNRTSSGFTCQAKATATTLVLVGTGWTGNANSGAANDVLAYVCLGYQ